MQMLKKTLQINCETLLKLGIDPNEAIEYLLKKETKDIYAVHITALQILKQKKPTVPS